jgi:RNA polymerase sigma-70 factor (ECF subfamily)
LDFEVSKETLLVQQQETDERSNRIVQCLSKLSGRQREIIYLKFYRGMSYEEISEIMDINYQAARNLLSNSLKALRPLLRALVNTMVILTYLPTFLSFF